MKYLLTTSLLFILNSSITAQKQITVCNAHDSERIFAMLANKTAFRNKHMDPTPYHYNGKAGKKITFMAADNQKAYGWELKAKKHTDNYLFVFHEWYGLNDYVKKESEKLHDDLGNVNVIALDLYDGKVATNGDEAGKYMQDMKPERGTAIIDGAIRYVGKKARIMTIGWCFGGGWSLQASIEAGKQATGCVMYYGMPEKDVARLKTLKTKVLAIFGSQDKWLNAQVVDQFKKDMAAAGKTLTVKVFDADHAFANPSNPKYDSEATREAYQLTLDFLKKCLTLDFK